MFSVDEIIEELMPLYGLSDDPMWNFKIRPHLEDAATLALKFENPNIDPRELVRIMFGFPYLATLVIKANGEDPKDHEFLTQTSSEVGDFKDLMRFILPSTAENLKILTTHLAELNQVQAEDLWPKEVPAPLAVTKKEPAAVTAAKLKLETYLRDMEPHSSLVAVHVVGSSDFGLLLWPHYNNDAIVFGGAQYFMGADGGMLCVPSVYPFTEVQTAYINGERTSDVPAANPEELPEVWSRNCAPTARAVAAVLEGNTEAAATGTLGHWEDGEFVDGETLKPMLAHLGLDIVPPLTLLSSVPSLLSTLPLGSHFIVGIRWKGWNRGHWFNIRHNGVDVEWIDGQSGTSGSWPPPFLERAEPEGMILRATAAKGSKKRSLF